MLDSSNTTLATVSVNDLYTNSSTIPNPSPVPFSFDFTGNTLQANTNFNLRLTASGQGSSGIIGNNAGIDNLVVNGNLVAVPWETDSLPLIGSTVLFGLGLWGKGKLAKSQK
ncbi:hypothetical protein H6G25_12900 [Dolichospermum sp. FACHB-1091]|uniref:hypothetical protein n=1 Tax=Dolichospermum sp. FACHB-1091 TaxID=2692798 RepID=UPI0016810356|nr:hypothetical protein [Dolichospermum sp. FACHB-1091]MBD2444065.1 hypothetical protein [Dolichospermum sp. FACHB-1091]